MSKQIRIDNYSKRLRIAIRFHAARISLVGRRTERLDSTVAKIETAIEPVQACAPM
jgi:hypothetical protein